MPTHAEAMIEEEKEEEEQLQLEIVEGTEESVTDFVDLQQTYDDE